MRRIQGRIPECNCLTCQNMYVVIFSSILILDVGICFFPLIYYDPKHHAGLGEPKMTLSYLSMLLVDKVQFCRC